MSRKEMLESACGHPEIIAIGLEVMLDPSRRRHYSPLVLALADGAMQQIVQIVTENSSSSVPREADSTR